MSADHIPSLLHVGGAFAASVLCGSLGLILPQASARADGVLTVGQASATMTLLNNDALRTYHLTTTAELRDHRPADQQITFAESADHASIRTGDVLFDGLYAMAVSEARENSVSQISDGSYARGNPIQVDAFRTGEVWTYVWTRDLSYSLYLGLAAFDPSRAVNSLLFKASGRKPSVSGGVDEQIVQDTGSGGSYPVSTDRVVWAMGADETLKYLAGAERQEFLAKVYPILCGTIEQDRHLVFDPGDGLYRGEQSFLDWRQQTYPGWTRDNVLAIGMSKALSVNAGNYFLLVHAAEYSRLLGKPETEVRYARWAADLRDAVNRRFWDPKQGLYGAYLLSDDGVSDSVRVARYDLLGESLTVLSGLADERQAASILEHYPTGPYGPPVVWPQERSVPIYHNQAIWPFVTAYWTKAARKTGHAAAVDAGVRSLEQLAALNLSNMENFDFVTGRAEVKSGPRTGPSINSRRQLWSVAAYLSMVQDVVFGLETSWDGIRFRPFITADMRQGIFRATDVIEWRGFGFHGTRNRVGVHLPPAGSFSKGVCVVDRIELNGKPVSADFVKTGDLRATNEWNIFLKAPGQGEATTAPLRVVNPDDEAACFGPLQPDWAEIGQRGITLEDGRLALNFKPVDPANVSMNIYRDGKLCAEGIRQTKWVDPESSDYLDRVHTYRAMAVDLQSGNVSHLTPASSYRTPGQEEIIEASSMHNHGGELVDNHYFKNWGQPDHELLTAPLKVPRRGSYIVRAEFSNGAGPLITGVTCAVKKLEITDVKSGAFVATGYLIMPQSGDWKRFDLSSAVRADLDENEEYVLRLSEDEYSRNMSYLQSNQRYTGSAGGGEASYNNVNIAALHLLFMNTR